MRYELFKNDVKPNQWARNVNIATQTGTKRIAEELRDKMRARFDQTVHQTDYGMGAGSSTLRNYIVISQLNLSQGASYSIGAKHAKIGNDPIDRIFYFMDQGTGIYNPSGRKEPWVFKLAPSRESMSESGYWVTQGQEGKGFITKVAQEFSGIQFQQSSLKNVTPAIDMALKIKV